MKDSLNIAIAGATGYVGLELIKILSKHPRAKILYLCANKSVGKKIYAFDKKIINKNLPIISKIKNISWNKINVLFTALPNGQAQKIAKIIPFIPPTNISLPIILNAFLEVNSLVARALTDTVNVCVPALPPIDATIGIKTANATTFSISS